MRVRIHGPVERELRASRHFDDHVGLDGSDWSEATCALWRECYELLGSYGGKMPEADKLALAEAIRRRL